MADSNYYEILGLQPSATVEEIRAAYFDLVKHVHPDAGGNEALFRQVNVAYETLNDPLRREAYDRSGYVNQEASGPGVAAPGWRQSDNKPPTRPGDRANPSSRPGSEESDEQQAQRDWEGSPPPPPPPPEQGPTQNDLGVGGVGRTLSEHVATNPSWALLAVGVFVLFVASDFGSATSSFIILGLCAVVVGFVGVLGRRRAAYRSAMQRADIAGIDLMTGTEFEQRLRAAFEFIGYTVYHVGGQGDFGADLVLDNLGPRIVVQAKRWSKAVGPGAVQEVVASQAHYGAHRAIVVTNSSFTKAALELARSNNVEMWDRSQLIDFLATQDLGPPRTGGALLADELRAGAPTALRGLFILLLAAFSATASRSKPRRKRKR